MASSFLCRLLQKKRNQSRNDKLLSKKSIDEPDYPQLKQTASLPAAWGIAYDKSNRITYLSSSTKITKITPDGTQSELQLNPPPISIITYVTLTRDGNTLYFSETSANRIQKIDLVTGAVQLVAGCGIGRKDGTCSVAAMHQPLGITLDQSEQHLFFCDSGNNCIRKIDLKKNIVTTIVGKTKGNQDGLFQDATFYLPHGLCFDSKRNMFVSDYLGNKIRYLNFETKMVTTVFGSSHGDWKDGPLEDATTIRPSTMFYDHVLDCLWFSDGSSCIRKLDLKSKTVHTIIATQNANLTSSPKCMCMDNNRNIIIADSGIGNVWKLMYNKKLDWKYVRLLWVGHLKNSSEYCWLAKLPRDLIREISKQILNLLYS